MFKLSHGLFKHGSNNFVSWWKDPSGMLARESHEQGLNGGKLVGGMNGMWSLESFGLLDVGWSTD